MHSRKPDPIAMVEACYDLRASHESWLLRLAEVALPLMGAETVLAYHIDLAETGLRLSDAVQAGNPKHDVVPIIARIGAAADRVRAGTGSVEDALMANGFRDHVLHHLSQPIEHLRLSELRGDRAGFTLGEDVEDLHFSLNRHIDGHGATCLVGSIRQSRPLRASERTTWLRLGAHVKSGLRLRRRLAAGSAFAVDAPVDGAVLDPLGRVVHADGEASDVDAREALSQLTRDVDHARTARTGRDEHALAVWEGVVDGRWSLVEQIDSDGRRFMLAHKNPEGVTDPRGLTGRTRSSCRRRR